MPYGDAMYLSIPVEEIMVSDVVTEPPETSVAEAARTMRSQGVGSVVVVRDGTPVGIVTEGDFVRHLYRLDDLGRVDVADVMSTPLLTVEPETTIVETADLLRDNELEHVPVVEPDEDDPDAASNENEEAMGGGELVGIVTASEVSYYLPQLLRSISRTESESEPEPEKRSVRNDTQYERESWTFDYHGSDTTTVSVGDVAVFSKQLSADDVEEFADATGDTNRLHLDAAYAAETRFGERIGHGVLTTGLISAALARLPGLTVYLSQQMSFLGPVSVGDRATARCEILEDLGERKFRIETTVADEDGDEVLDGEAVVLIDELPPEHVLESSETAAD